AECASAVGGVAEQLRTDASAHPRRRDPEILEHADAVLRRQQGGPRDHGAVGLGDLDLALDAHPGRPPPDALFVVAPVALRDACADAATTAASVIAMTIPSRIKRRTGRRPE